MKLIPWCASAAWGVNCDDKFFFLCWFSDQPRTWPIFIAACELGLGSWVRDVDVPFFDRKFNFRIRVDAKQDGSSHSIQNKAVIRVSRSMNWTYSFACALELEMARLTSAVVSSWLFARNRAYGIQQIHLHFIHHMRCRLAVPVPVPCGWILSRHNYRFIRENHVLANVDGRKLRKFMLKKTRFPVNLIALPLPCRHLCR